MLSHVRAYREMAISLLLLTSIGCGGGVELPQGGGIPILDAISPDSVDAGSPAFTLVLTGRTFAPDAVVRWGGAARPTEYVSAKEVRASIEATDVSGVGTADVTVENPGEGGGTSAGLPFDIAIPATHPAPVISSIEPVQAPVGSPGLTLTLHGTGFLPFPHAAWNGSVRPATYVSSTVITVALTAEDLATAGLATVAAESYPPGHGASNIVLFRVLPAGVLTLRTLDLPAYDLMHDPASGFVYVAVAGNGGAHANSLTKINPASATISTSVFIGSEPRRISRSEDGHYFYVALGGAAAVRRYDVRADVADLEFPLGTDATYGPMYAEDIAVFPGQPLTVAVSTMYASIVPRDAGVRIYDDGVVRPTATPTPQFNSANEIEAASGTTLYGGDSDDSGDGVYTMRITTDGVIITDVVHGLSGGAMTLAEGRLYTSSGRVIDPVTGLIAGTFTGAYGAFAVDLPNDRIFYLYDGKILAYQPSNFAYVGSIDGIAGLNTGQLVRWGANGLAFIEGRRFNNPGTTVHLLTTSLLPGP